MDIYDNDHIWIFSLAAILLVTGLLTAIIRQVFKRKELETKNNQEAEIRALKYAIESGNRNYYEIWDDKARDIYQELNLTIRHRLSIYEYVKSNNTFRLLGRHADYHEFKMRGRRVYPAKEGAIGIAWENGKHYTKTLPNPESNYGKYLEESLKKFKLSEASIEAMKMKPQCIYAKSINDLNKTPTALLMIESSKKDSIDCELVDRRLRETHEQAISEMLEAYKFAEPSLKIAYEMGL